MEWDSASLAIRAELEELAVSLRQHPQKHELVGDQLLAALTLLRAAAANFDQHCAIVDGVDEPAPPQRAHDLLVAVDLMIGLLGGHPAT